MLDGHETILFSLTPRRGAKPRTREGSQMRAFAVRAWVSESDRELVRVDAEAIDTLLVAVLRRIGLSEFSDYREFSVDTSTTYLPPTPSNAT